MYGGVQEKERGRVVHVSLTEVDMERSSLMWGPPCHQGS